MSRRAGMPRLLLALLAGALALRLAAALYLGDVVTPLPGIYDQVSYHELALRVLSGHGFSFGQDWWPATPANTPTAHWSFLYTLYLSAVYALVGVHPLAARLLQAALVGVLLPWLTYRLTRRLWPEQPAVAWLAALWSGYYGYFIYYAAALMTEGFYLVASLWVLDTSLKVARNGFGRSRDWAALGLAIGTAALLRQVFLLFVPFLLLWLGWQVGWKQRAVSGRPAARATLIGLAISLLVAAGLVAPVTWRNYRVFDRFVLLNTNAGFAFYWANHPVHGTQFNPLLEGPGQSYQELIPAELAGLNEAALADALLARGLGFVRADPLRFIRLSVSRIPTQFMFWVSADSPALSNIVRVASFGLALPFMLSGVAAWLPDIRRARAPLAPGLLVLLFMVVYTAVHLLSWAGIRYRLPTDAAALPFAARGLLACLPARLRAAIHA